jgi:hypothetical protein
MLLRVGLEISFTFFASLRLCVKELSFNRSFSFRYVLGLLPLLIAAAGIALFFAATKTKQAIS